MKGIVILIIFLTSFCYLLICQINYNENFNQPSGTILCYNCTNVSIEICNTLCSGINCFINLKLPLLTNNIISYGCTSDLVDSGCINNTDTDDVTCYCNGNFCNYPEIVNISETDNSSFYEEEETTSMPSALSIDYPTVENLFTLKNISKRDVGEANNDFLQFIETLQFLDDFFDSFDNITIKNETESVDTLDEDKILQMLNRLDYVFEQKMTNFFKSIEHNISSLPDRILKNSNLNKVKTQSFYDNVYGDYENSGTSSRSHLFSRIWKQISKLYFKESSEHLKHKNKKYYYVNKQETTISNLEDVVITYNYEMNSFVLEILDKNFNYKHIIIKKHYPPENFTLIQSTIAYVASFGEKLGIVSGSIRKKLVSGLEISIQEQLNQTLTAANVAFKSYTEALFSKVLAIMTNFIPKTQSRKKKSLTFQFKDKNFTYVFQDQYHKIVNIYRKNRREVNETSITHNLEMEFPFHSTEMSDFAYEIYNKTQAYDNMLNNSNNSGKIPMMPVLTGALLSPFPALSPLPPEPDNFGSFETTGTLSVINQNNSQFPNMSLTTIAENINSNIPNNNQSLSSLVVPNIINVTRFVPLTTTPNNTITESVLNTNLASMIMNISSSNITTTMESITGTNMVTTISAYTTTDVITTTHSQTTVPMDLISTTTTTKKVTTTTSPLGYFASIYNRILSLFGYGDSLLSPTIMAKLLTKDELPPDVIIDNNGQYTLTNGTIVSVSQLEEMLKKSKKSSYPTTTQSSDLISNIILSIKNSFYSFLTSFVNEFTTHFSGGNITAIEEVKDVLESLTNEIIEVNSTILSNENSTSAVSPLSMLTGFLSVISSHESKKRSLDSDLNIISDNIFLNTINVSTNSSNVQRLGMIFKETLSNKKLSHVFIDYITKNVILSEKEKSQLSRTIFQTITSIMSNLTLQKIVNQKLVEYSKENLLEDDYDETYTEKMEQLMEEMGKNIGKISNTILENILIATNNYNTVDKKDVEETVYNDGYQLGIKVGFAIKPNLTNFDIMMKRIEKKKKKFVDCINDFTLFSRCFTKWFMNYFVNM